MTDHHSILSQLASTQDRRDELPNRQLADKIVTDSDSTAVSILVEHLADKKKDIRHDCIKVLYEIGAQSPGLISGYLSAFLATLNSEDNRMQWGAMSAIDSIALEIPEQVHDALPQILEAADRGSVITKDHAMGVLIKLMSLTDFADDAFPLLLEMLKKSPTNQLPMYAERAVNVITDHQKKAFVSVLRERLPEIEKESKQKRVEKVIKKLA